MSAPSIKRSKYDAKRDRQRWLKAETFRRVKAVIEARMESLTPEQRDAIVRGDVPLDWPKPIRVA